MRPFNQISATRARSSLQTCERGVDHSRDRSGEQYRREDHDRHREVPDSERVDPDQVPDEQQRSPALATAKRAAPPVRGNANFDRDRKAARENSSDGRQRAAAMMMADIEAARTTCCRTRAQAPAPAAAAATAQTIATSEAAIPAAWMTPKLIERVRSALLAAEVANRNSVSPPAITRGATSGSPRASADRVGGEGGHSRSNRPRPERRPERSRRPALGCGLGLDQRGSESETSEGHRERRERDSDSCRAVFIRSQQPGEGDNPDEPDRLDSELRPDRPYGAPLERALDLVRRDIRWRLLYARTLLASDPP